MVNRSWQILGVFLASLLLALVSLTAAVDARANEHWENPEIITFGQAVYHDNSLDTFDYGEPATVQILGRRLFARESAVTPLSTNDLSDAVSDYVAGSAIREEAIYVIDGNSDFYDFSAGMGQAVVVSVLPAAVVQSIAVSRFSAASVLINAGAESVLVGNVLDPRYVPIFTKTTFVSSGSTTRQGVCDGTFIFRPIPTKDCLGDRLTIIFASSLVGENIYQEIDRRLSLYNDASLASGNDANIIRADINGLFMRILENPARYGYDAALTIQATPVPGAVVSGVTMTHNIRQSPLGSYCYGDANSACYQHTLYGRNGSASDENQLLFINENLEPTASYRAINEDYMTDIVYAPTEVSLLPEIGLYGVRHHTENIVNYLRRTRGQGGAAENCHAGLNYEHDNLGLNGPAAPGNIISRRLSGGCGASVGDYARLGFSADFSQGKIEIDERRSEYDASGFGGAAYAELSRGGFFARGIAAAAYNKIDAKRTYRLGSGNHFDATGDTSGIAYGLESAIGYNLLGAGEKTRIAPALVWSYRHSEIDGYTESGEGISNYVWDDLASTSHQLQLGLAAAHTTSENIVLNADVYYVQEQEDNLRHVSIISVNDPGNRYRLPGFQREDNGFWRMHMGLTYTGGINSLFSMSWDYSGQGRGSNNFYLSYRYIY